MAAVEAAVVVAALLVAGITPAREAMAVMLKEALAISEEVRARRTPASRVKILVTALNHPANRVRHRPRVTATSSSVRTHAVPARNQEASHAMISTTSNPPATPLQASRLPGSPRAATGATSVADAPVVVVVVAGATGLVGRAVLARLLADKA